MDSDSEALIEPNGLIPYEEVQKHVTADDCWVIIDGNVYDVTYFLKSHPGGKQAILLRAGKDVTKLFSQIHPTNALASLRPEACLGTVNPDTLPALDAKDEEDEIERQEARNEMPPPEDLLLIKDFEEWAERVLSKTAWYYYRSAADEETTFHENRDAFRRYFFRPRMLRDLTNGSAETTFVGIPTALPIFISPAAMAKLGHPLGEVNMTRAAAECGIVQSISANASCSLEEMFAAREDSQPLIYQVYLNKDRTQSESILRKVERMGAKAVMFTVDTAGDSKRTLDERLKVAAAAKLREDNGKTTKSEPLEPLAIGHAISGYQDRNLTWKDIGFIRKNTKLPIIVKGIQSVEDVQLCVDHGVEGVILSNHGGRQADYAPAPIDVLYEIRVLRPDLFDKIDIMIDGGVRTGADVVKAVALGAKAVGLGRPFLYANGTHGQEGVRRVIEILHEEIVNTMRNIGAATIKDLKPDMVGPAGPWVGHNRPMYVSSGGIDQRKI
ncbi:mitochondrial fmn-dependent dehydrogenase [Grosmannia clavigera kw1407]|uniref:L-lactate dehydrogenase (cytochrome) n=1 Tax=Grosmannia clavigera (strain kw1407 / UAMH 11150) TaxID=655863 RepID=F0XNM9_GROCL|nr:mitochondrial fmn-dependent dehydrogenase [Grosmannia clavigera kw1407]EFX00064.1 mitochondrial fmn-dependent dehydrogenase [Grosmannia clavigera kw1407]